MGSIIGAAIVASGLLAASNAMAFDLQGHRGARGLAPENTLEAFRTALAIGVSTLELDLAMTRDGILVVSHDSVLNPDHTRGPDGKFLAAAGPAIRSLTLDEVKRYDVGRLKPGTSYAARFPHSGDGRRSHPGLVGSLRPRAAGEEPTTSVSTSRPS